MSDRRVTDWLPTTRKEAQMRGWEELDVVIFSGDAYVDHPSFGAAVIGRLLEAEGLRVAIVPQPNWQDDLRDFKKMGRPRLFFGISAGCMDSMVNKYTAAKRFRSEDAYSPDGKHSMRPEYATIVYSNILKEIYPDAPVVIGGIEASMRRFTHYDYWQDSLRKSILVDSKADVLVYGMGEQPIIALTSAMKEHLTALGAEYVTAGDARVISRGIRQTGYLARRDEVLFDEENDRRLAPHSECLKSKEKQAANFLAIEKESNRVNAKRLLQETDEGVVVINPPFPTMTTEQLDHSFDLPYTRLPHPKYKGKRIPAYDMIKHSVNIHRGCFGGCAFCTISAHQGKFIVNRSQESILREVEAISKMDDFKGYLSDLGGPSANMYMMKGKNSELCAKCSRPSCIQPKICPNMNADHSPLLELYKRVDAMPGIKKSFIGSGVRYDMLLHKSGDAERDAATARYTEELIKHHVSGRLKVAPEHTGDAVLKLMRKPPFRQFHEFKRIFDRINSTHNLKQQIIPYFISSHPGSTLESMAELAAETRQLNFHLEQVQDFTPTPMTMATEMYYTGINPETGEKVYVARSMRDKEAQRRFFFWYKPEERKEIARLLRSMRRPDLLKKLGM
ncbi:MAG: YgiQ family radical SAM protein [Bacteroidaceae bacterium]|nr:YgiQ family radical SAM protein [Bacteroidaceae bacterium]